MVCLFLIGILKVHGLYIILISSSMIYKSRSHVSQYVGVATSSSINAPLKSRLHARETCIGFQYVNTINNSLHNLEPE